MKYNTILLVSYRSSGSDSDDDNDDDNDDLRPQPRRNLVEAEVAIRRSPRKLPTVSEQHYASGGIDRTINKVCRYRIISSLTYYCK